jgi:hypothetical protein
MKKAALLVIRLSAIHQNEAVWPTVVRLIAKGILRPARSGGLHLKITFRLGSDFARVGPTTTPTRARRLVDASVDQTDARNKQDFDFAACS